MARNSIVVSLRARGINTFQYQHLLDFTQHLSNLFNQFLDIGCSGVVFLQLQSWSTWISVLLTLLACIFYHVYQDGRMKMSGSIWLILGFVIILPLLGALFQAFQRREEALRQLAKVKAALVSFYCTFQDSLPDGQVHHGEELQASLQQLLDGLRAYFQHPRRYARHYTNPLLSNDPVPSKTLYEMSKTLGIHLTTMQHHLRHLHRSCQLLDELGASSTSVLHARSCVLKVHAAFERLSMMKEFRSPQILRSMLRFYILIILPVLASPYWVWLGRELRKFGLAVILALLVQLALCGLLSCAFDLEDPFHEVALDSVSTLEITDHVSMMLEDYHASARSPTISNGPIRSGTRQRPKPVASNAVSNPSSPHPVAPRFPKPAPPTEPNSKAQSMPPMPPLAGPGYPGGGTDSAV